MKKSSIFLGAISLLSIILLWNFINAEYQLQIDEKDNEVYLTSWDNKITLENAEKALSWDVNSGSTLTISITSPNSQTNTWSEINSWDTTWTWEINTWTVVWTWTETNTWSTTSTWTETTRTLWENINAELLTWDEFDKALYWITLKNSVHMTSLQEKNLQKWLVNFTVFYDSLKKTNDSIVVL